MHAAVARWHLRQQCTQCSPTCRVHQGRARQDVAEVDGRRGGTPSSPLFQDDDDDEKDDEKDKYDDETRRNKTKQDECPRPVQSNPVQIIPLLI